eukprot:GHVU01107276.1.p1 GENE.GHVU01107276.1~~GHVU01107276.1.p1  ORF type:complete len:124 (-),score=3.94 GHVU01107276.1:238-582(-)
MGDSTGVLRLERTATITMDRFFGVRSGGDLTPWQLKAESIGDSDSHFNGLPTRPSVTPTPDPTPNPTPTPETSESRWGLPLPRQLGGQVPGALERPLSINFFVIVRPIANICCY